MDEMKTRESVGRILQDRPVMVLAPHPDDESLGCGALLSAAFDSLGAHVVCVTDGRFSHPNSRMWPGDRLAARREAELHEAVRILGGGPEAVTFLRYRDCHAPVDGAELTDAAGRIAALCRTGGFGTLIAPAPEDPHKDHVAVAKLARAVHAMCPGLRLYDYSVWSRWHRSWPETPAELHLDTAPWQARKAAAIAAHRSQLGLVVQGDPEGFIMTADFTDFFARSPERFREVRG